MSTSVIWGTTDASMGDWKEGYTEARVLDLVRPLTPNEPNQAVWLHQVHQGDVRKVTAADHGFLGDADGLITNEPGIVLTIRIADCVPVFVSGPGVIGLLHAGFGGTKHGILSNAFEAIVREYDLYATECRVSFGPHICGDCYEIYGPRLEETAKNLELAPFIHHKGGKSYFSLQEALVSQAQVAGADADESRQPCTFHDRGYFSARKGNDARRMLSYMMLVHA